MFNIKKLFFKLKINISSIIFYYKKRIFIKKLANTTLENMKKISRKKLEKKSDLPIHLAIGHENLSSVVSLVKNQYDNFVLTHRNIHFNFALSDQSDYEKIINETLLEKESINAGNYGCMTMRNSRKGIIYTSSILANNISVGLGIASTNFKNGDLTDKIRIDDVINDNKKKSGHFFIFHELSAKFQDRILLRNSCYTSYNFKNNVQSVVHGNLPVLAENQRLIPYKKNIIQVSHLKKYDYLVQNNFKEYDKVEAFLFNPINIDLKVKINELSFTLKSLSSKIINLPTAEIYKVKSKCLLMRPILFVYKDKIFDVFHG